MAFLFMGIDMRGCVGVPTELDWIASSGTNPIALSKARTSRDGLEVEPRDITSNSPFASAGSRRSVRPEQVSTGHFLEFLHPVGGAGWLIWRTCDARGTLARWPIASITRG